MRHFRQAGAVAPLTRGMGATTRPAGLIAFSRRPQRGPPGRLRADRPAIALAAITTAANQKLQTTLGTMAQAGQRKFHGRLRPSTEGPPGRRPHLRRILSLQPCPARLGRGGGEESLGGPTAHNAGRRSGSGWVGRAEQACPPHAVRGVSGSPPSRPSSPGALHHRGWEGVNPDASLLPGGRGSDADARHGCDDPAGRPDSACPPPGARPGGPPARRPARSSAGRGHNGCKSETADHNEDNGPDGPAEVPWAPSACHQRSTWTPSPPAEDTVAATVPGTAGARQRSRFGDQVPVPRPPLRSTGFTPFAFSCQQALFRDDPGHEGLKTPATGTPARSRPAQVGHPDLLPLSSPRPSALLPGEGCSGSPGAGRGKTRNLTAVAADSVGITRECRQRPWGQAGDNPLMRVAPSLPPLIHPLPPLRRATPPSA